MNIAADYPHTAELMVGMLGLETPLDLAETIGLFQLTLVQHNVMAYIERDICKCNKPGDSGPPLTPARITLLRDKGVEITQDWGHAACGVTALTYDYLTAFLLTEDRYTMEAVAMKMELATS